MDISNTVPTRTILLNAINISKFNTRKDLNAGTEDGSIDDLAQSIAEQGLLSPPVVREVSPGRYEVIAGQRRILACRKLGWETIEVKVRNDLDDDQAIAVSLVENVQRADMHPMDKARAYQALERQYGNILAVSKKTGVTTATIRKYLSLLQLSPELQQHVDTGSGSSGVGVMAQLAKTFKNPDDMNEAWRQIGGFKSNIIQTILRESDGDLDKIEPLVDLAIEGAFDRPKCGDSLETCPFLPYHWRPKINELRMQEQLAGSPAHEES
jgi:ParB family chromosome partitioning protein